MGSLCVYGDECVEVKCFVVFVLLLYVDGVLCVGGFVVCLLLRVVFVFGKVKVGVCWWLVYFVFFVRTVKRVV